MPGEACRFPAKNFSTCTGVRAGQYAMDDVSFTVLNAIATSELTRFAAQYLTHGRRVNASRRPSREAAHHSGVERSAKPSREDFHSVILCQNAWRTVQWAICGVCFVSRHVRLSP